MQKLHRLLFYLSINVIVSALTALIVLLIWGNLRQSQWSDTCNPVPETANPAIQSSGGGKGTVTTVDSSGQLSETSPDDGGDVIIVSIVGAGDLALERVIVQRKGGEGELSLANWTLRGEKGLVYTFPYLILYKDGAVNVHSTSGVDTVNDLYWGLQTAAWYSGAVATLVDAHGNTRSVYQVP